jgi:hypothetical protein
VENVDNYTHGFYLLETTTVKVVNRYVYNPVDNYLPCGLIFGVSQNICGYSYVHRVFVKLIHKLSTENV